MSIRLLGIILAGVMQGSAYADGYVVETEKRDSLVVHISDMWQLAKEHHLLFQVKRKELEMASANLKQERLFDNPQVDISHNINNPVTHRYFEINRDGETDVQVSQRIYIGGQRGERIRKAGEELRRTEYECDDALRILRRDLSGLMIQLAYLRQKVAVVDKEITSAEKIMEAYEKQAYKGNVSGAEAMRIRSQYIQLQRERSTLATDIVSIELSIAQMTGLGRIGCIIPEINYAESVAVLNGVSFSSITGNISDRADLQASRHDVMSAMHEVKLQKANALPEVCFTGEWDKNGNIGRNCFALGVSITLPVFNRNQGRVKYACALLEAKRMQHEWSQRQALSEVDAAWERLQANMHIAQEAERHLDSGNENLMEEVVSQYMKRNISLIELLDYYQSYKDTHYLVIESRRDVLTAMTELDLEIK
jgi:cobalt-zinc-cadmium efflux system outer membrane protein